MTKPEWNQLARMIAVEQHRLEETTPPSPEQAVVVRATIRILTSLERIARSMG